MARLNSGTVRLIDSDRLVGQICGLRGIAGSSGRETIDHGSRSHDDLANAAASAVAMVAERRYGYDTSLSWVCGPYKDAQGNPLPPEPPPSRSVELIRALAWRQGRIMT